MCFSFSWLLVGVFIAILFSFFFVFHNGHCGFLLLWIFWSKCISFLNIFFGLMSVWSFSALVFKRSTIVTNMWMWDENEKKIIHVIWYSVIFLVCFFAVHNSPIDSNTYSHARKSKITTRSVQWENGKINQMAEKILNKLV